MASTSACLTWNSGGVKRASCRSLWLWLVKNLDCCCCWILEARGASWHMGVLIMLTLLLLLLPVEVCPRGWVAWSTAGGAADVLIEGR